MKKISSKAFLIAGLIVEFGSPFFIGFIAILFPHMPEKIGMPIIFFLYCSGTILFVMSLTKRRIEKGKIIAYNIFKALTPAQVCLVSSMIVLFVGVLLGELVNETAGGILGVLAFIGIFVSTILAIVRAVQRIRKFKAEVSASGVSHTPVTSGVQYKPKDYCERCGTAADRGTLKELNGHKFCSSCAEIMIAAQSSELLKAKAKCCVCGNEFEKSKMIFVDDQYICNNCFRSRYAGSVPIDDNKEDL